MKFKTMYRLIFGSLIACGKDHDTHYQYHATHVRVSNMEHEVILEITTQSQLDAFNAHWISKNDTGKFNKMSINEFQCFIDVRAKSGGGRWLYSSEGYVTKLDHIPHRLYRIALPHEFNQIIGITE